MSDLSGTALGKYRLLTQLGRGGMAEVYLARQQNLDRHVAVKVLRPHIAADEDFVSRFEREATAVAHLRHSGIVQVYDFDAAAGVYYMVLEFIEGPTLAAELRERALRGRPLAPVELAYLFTRLASALDYAHARGVVHQDLKPSNIMLTLEGLAVLTDFGVAYIFGGANPSGVAGTPAYMAPEQALGQRGDKRSDVYALGVVLYESLTGHLPFEGATAEAVLVQQREAPVPDPADYRPELPEAVSQILFKALSKQPDFRYQSAGEMAGALREALGVTPQELAAAARPFIPLAAAVQIPDEYETPVWVREPVPECPYRGLFAFQEADAAYFFGREDFTDRLFNTVYAERRPLVAVIGPSGSGKSSVVSAGLLPRLRQGQAMRGARGQAWVAAVFRPGPQPFHSLAAELLAVQGLPASEAERLTAVQEIGLALRDKRLSLAEVIELMLRSNPDYQRLLLVADQFEELYTLCPDAELRGAFLDLLLDAARLPWGQRHERAMTLLVTMRADFLGEVFSHRPFADALQDNSLILGPMTNSELRQAIENPARMQGVAFQSGLVERLLDDVAAQPGNLPLLEFALTALWSRMSEGRLTHAAYDAIGHVEGALARYAEEFYSELSDPEKELSRRVFVQLVRPGEGTDDVRRQATRADLEPQWALVQRLADARLVVTSRDPAGQETVEIVHEALVHSWKRLRQWMQADRSFRAWQERLRTALHQWEASARDEGALLRGALLVGAEGWYAEREAELSQAERDYIGASAALREREAAEREALRRRELEAAQMLAASERRRAEEQTRVVRRMRRPTLVLAGALLLALLAIAAILRSGSAANASLQRSQATAQAALLMLTQSAAHARTAQAHELASAALDALNRDPQLSLLLAMEAARATYLVDGTWVPEAEAALRQSLAATGAAPAAGTAMGDLLSLAAKRVTRPLTLEECRLYLHLDACPG
jgi:tRNA A-37 threonylcarbamoyl transferase component Bud32